MKNDIQCRNDIETIVVEFYKKALEDDVIGYLFTDVIEVNWPVHIPRIVDFWDSVIFSVGNFSGNPMEKHMSLHEKSPMNSDHFKRWLQLFDETSSQYFEGPNANLLKDRAKSIAAIMEFKVLNQS